MIASLLHRGPDGWGTYCSQNIALGHSRLSIIDLRGGNQPMNSDRYVISFNGEIYNYLELREELIRRGFSLLHVVILKVLMKVIEVYGESGIAKLNGQFAFLFWD
jgi:asparagine synthase (glutamine-hydrolysing)